MGLSKERWVAREIIEGFADDYVQDYIKGEIKQITIHSLLERDTQIIVFEFNDGTPIQITIERKD